MLHEYRIQLFESQIVGFFFNTLAQSFVVKLANDAHVLVETKGQKDKYAQIKRKALQGWVKAVDSMGTWEKWHEGLSTHPSDLAGLLGQVSKS